MFLELGVNHGRPPSSNRPTVSVSAISLSPFSLFFIQEPAQSNEVRFRIRPIFVAESFAENLYCFHPRWQIGVFLVNRVREIIRIDQALQ